jgi:hypothetical protein
MNGEDIQTLGGSICCRMLDHYSEGFRRSTTIPYKDQEFMGRHQQVFEAIPLGRPPYRGFENTIELEEGDKPMITPPYHHPKRFKDEIEKEIKELLAMGHIRWRNNPFSSSVVLVLKKDGTMRMCIDYRALNKKTIKNRYPIPGTDELMDEMHGAVLF